MNEQKIKALWSHLHWFTILAQQGSFTAAAARLGVSKAAMSQHIAELERVAGVALVSRTTRSVRLTEAGERLVEDIRGPFEQIALGFEGVQDTAATPHGLVRVTAPVAFSRQQLIPRVADFLREYPNIRLEIDMSDRLRSLTLEGFDLAVRHTVAPPETHVAWKLAATRTILVASKAYLRRRGLPRTPGDLADHSCLHYPRAQGTPTWTFVPAQPSKATGRAASAKAGDAHVNPVSVAVSGPLAVNNSEALRDGAIGGLGIALLPDFSAQSALEAKKLVEVLPAWRPTGAFGDSLYLIRPQTPHVPRAARAFVAFLREAFGTGFSARTNV